MITIAITGGIGAGKSTLTKYLLSLGYLVIDADNMAREITAPGGKAIPYIVEHFGMDYLTADGGMDRAKMRDLVFNNPSAKSMLEEGTTKVVIQDIDEIKETAKDKGVKVIFFDIPQLFENGIDKEYDQVWSIIADYDVKKKRIAERDGIEEEIIDLIIGSQSEDEYRINNSTEIIVNNGTKEELFLKVDKLIEKYSI